MNVVALALQREKLSARNQIPELDGSVIRPGCEASAAGREGHGENGAAVALQREKVIACNETPEPDGVVTRPRREVIAVRRDG